MNRRLHILVTCTKLKTTKPENALVMRKVPGRQVHSRLQKWLKRLRKAKGPTLEAGTLYAGDHWQICASLPSLAVKRGYDPTLWIMSAGYGLIESTCRIHAYSAAFSPGHPDSVVPNGHSPSMVEGFREWWTGMMASHVPAGRQPHSISQLVQSDPTATFLVVASELYLAAVWPDLLEAARLAERGGGHIIIVSAGMKKIGALAELAMPMDARLQAILGGARRSLNARMARKLLSWMSPGVENGELRDRVARMMRSVTIVSQEQRPKCTDEEVSQFIRGEFARRSDISATSLLRRWRGEVGRACEQKRFSRLFRQTKEMLVA